MSLIQAITKEEEEWAQLDQSSQRIMNCLPGILDYSSLIRALVPLILITSLLGCFEVRDSHGRLDGSHGKKKKAKSADYSSQGSSRVEQQVLCISQLHI